MVTYKWVPHKWLVIPRCVALYWSPWLWPYHWIQYNTHTDNNADVSLSVNSTGLDGIIPVSNSTLKYLQMFEISYSLYKKMFISFWLLTAAQIWYKVQKVGDLCWIECNKEIVHVKFRPVFETLFVNSCLAPVLFLTCLLFVGQVRKRTGVISVFVIYKSYI